MGKRQHQKDKLYLTTTEWTYVYGGRRPDQDLADEVRQRFRRLPYDHCALSLQPFTDPYCNAAGYQFDLANIVPFLQKFNIDPISGAPLEAKQLTKLVYHKNADGEYHCPVMFKTFNENSHIVANRVTGNVYSNEAVEELNIKTKNYRDLLNDQPFTRKDIITLQDPLQVDKMNAAEFYHFKHGLQWQETEDAGDPKLRIKKMDQITKATLDELSKTEEKFEGASNEAGTSSSAQDKKQTAKIDIARANYSTGRAAASLTSTVMAVHTSIDAAVLSDDTIKYQRVKKKGYVTLQTTFGPLNFELHCEHVPKTCDNFLRLCRERYYDNTIFHRLIRNFMVQGGDPSGTGKGGQSIFGAPFEDEFVQHLSHSGRGILSMANAGPNSNKSQFFITFRSCKHLDKKHTVFGKLVGGLETLEKIEKTKSDDKDRPLDEIRITKAVIYVDPFQEILDNIDAERKSAQEAIDGTAAAKAPAAKPIASKPLRSGVGAFIDLSALTEKSLGAASAIDGTQGQETAKTSKKGGSSAGAPSKFGSFSNW